MITVYHSIPVDGNFHVMFDLCNSAKVIDYWKAGGYQKVAEVPTDDFEIAWRKTNSVNESWFERADLTVFLRDAMGLRSSMIGDVFILSESDARMVDLMGFTKIDLPK